MQLCHRGNRQSQHQTANAPRPRAAHHRRCAAPAQFTTPTDDAISSSAINRQWHRHPAHSLLPDGVLRDHRRPVKVAIRRTPPPRRSPGRSRPSVWRDLLITRPIGALSPRQIRSVSIRRSSAPNRTRFTFVRARSASGAKVRDDRRRGSLVHPSPSVYPVRFFAFCTHPLYNNGSCQQSYHGRVGWEFGVLPY